MRISISITVPDHLLKRVDALAGENDASRSRIISRAIAEMLARLPEDDVGCSNEKRPAE